MENTIVNGILTEGINLNTLMRMIRNKRNSSELIKLPLKIINSVLFEYLQDFREFKNIDKSCSFLVILHLDFGCKGNLCQQTKSMEINILLCS